MTRRDYIFLADCFALTLSAPGLTMLERIGVGRAARDMAYKLAMKNPRFDQGMFLHNCGIAGPYELTPAQSESYGGTSSD